jgi:hypothetical protein
VNHPAVAATETRQDKERDYSLARLHMAGVGMANGTNRLADGSRLCL